MKATKPLAFTLTLPNGATKRPPAPRHTLAPDLELKHASQQPKKPQLDSNPEHKQHELLQKRASTMNPRAREQERH